MKGSQWAIVVVNANTTLHSFQFQTECSARVRTDCKKVISITVSNPDQNGNGMHLAIAFWQPYHPPPPSQTRAPIDAYLRGRTLNHTKSSRINCGGDNSIIISSSSRPIPITSSFLLWFVFGFVVRIVTSLCEYVRPSQTILSGQNHTNIVCMAVRFLLSEQTQKLRLYVCKSVQSYCTIDSVNTTKYIL